MAIFSYSRLLSAFSKGCALDRLDLEIRHSPYISIALDSISQSGSTIQIVFKAELSTPEEAALDQIIEAHSGQSLEDQRNSSGIPYVALYGASNEVQVVGRDGSQFIACTHDFADKTTWYGDSVRTTEVLSLDTEDVTGKTYKSTHGFWVDLYHGKVRRESDARSSATHAYAVLVHVGGVLQTMRPPFKLGWTSGGDYYIDYRAGKVIFQTVPAEAPDVTYSYATGSSWYLFASPDKIMDVEKVETQFSENVDMRDCMVFEAVVRNGSGGYIVVGEIDRYDTVDQVIDTALGSYPVIPALGGEIRGTQAPTYGFPFEYRTKLPVTSVVGARVKLAEDLEFGSLDSKRSRLTATFYTVVR